MKRYLFDTNIASDYVNRRHDVFQKARAEFRKGNVIGIATPVLAGLIAGIEKSRSRDRNMASLRAVLGHWKFWAFDVSSAHEYGRISANLLRIGRPIGIIDTMVAAVAFTLANCTVVSTDSDMLSVAGLSVENWRV
ncbi:MAG: type II toxin-antitoxin system VapC family toxin [Gemmataceae bacterium]|nr:type II toxin-antitoxin system VapC family toxin [Gemmataceae bacterium]